MRKIMSRKYIGKVFHRKSNVQYTEKVFFRKRNAYD